MKQLADEAPSILWRSAKDSAKASARQASAAVRDVGQAVKVGAARVCMGRLRAARRRTVSLECLCMFVWA
jgi:hypothetical protein